MYADDHQIFVAHETMKRVEKILVDNGEKMTKWYQDNLLKVNCDKYQAIVLGNPKGERNTDLDISGEKVEQSQSIKILGVTLDENLNFKDHLRSVCKKVAGMIGVLRRLKNLIPVNAKLLLYKSAIMPHLTYCHLVWHFCTASDNRRLERLQERALRLMYNTIAESYDALLKRAKLTTLQNRRLQDILILMFKVKNKLTTNEIANIFNINDENTNNKGYNLKMQILSYLGLKVLLMEDILLDFLDHNCGQEERNIGTLATFRTTIRKKDVTFLEGCESECCLCLG